jgi:hypothetical protein
MENSINNREMFAMSMHQALNEQAGESTPRIQFYARGPHGCPYLVKTIPQMRFNPKNAKAMDDHKDDHAVVACCYYLMSHSADPKNEFTVTGQLRPWMKEKQVRPYILGQDNVRERR